MTPPPIQQPVVPAAHAPRGGRPTVTAHHGEAADEQAFADLVADLLAVARTAPPVPTPTTVPTPAPAPAGGPAPEGGSAPQIETQSSTQTGTQTSGVDVPGAATRPSLDGQDVVETIDPAVAATVADPAPTRGTPSGPRAEPPVPSDPASADRVPPNLAPNLAPNLVPGSPTPETAVPTAPRVDAPRPATTETGSTSPAGTSDTATSARPETPLTADPARSDAHGHDEPSGHPDPRATSTDAAAPPVATVAIDRPLAEGAPAPTLVTVQPGTASPTVLPPAAGSASAAPTTAALAPARRTPVTDQVAPQVLRLVQAGPGTHRIVLRLDPPDLGPVRVTLTVAEGAVRVRMAASSDAARAALLEGSPELHRLLGAAQGAQTRISVHDLNSLGTFSLAEPRALASSPPDPGSAGAQGGSPGTGDPGAHASGRDRDGGDPHQSAPARTPVSTHAMDGGTAEATTPQPIHTPGSRSRLDLSI